MRILIALFALLAITEAQAQGLPLFPASQYGRATLNLPQSTAGVSSIQLQNVLGRNANFERLDSYRAQDRFRRIALPVGRLDLLVAGPLGAGVANCTASIISARHIITNAHCFPEGRGTVKQASLLMDFYSEDKETTAKRFEVKVVPVERNVELDFAIAEVSGNPSATFGRIALEPRDPEPGESLLIIHHPMGMPKHMTRGGCRAHAPVSVQGTDIRHRCDTLPGSSGSPILSEGSGRMLGLHYGGSPNPGPNTWNFGKRLSEISASSNAIAAALADQRKREEDAARAERAEVERRLKEQLDAERRKAPSPGPVASRTTQPAPPGPSRQLDRDGRWIVEYACGRTPETARGEAPENFSVRHEIQVSSGQISARREYPHRLPGFHVTEEWSGEYRGNLLVLKIVARATSRESPDVHYWEYEWEGGAVTGSQVQINGSLITFPKGVRTKRRSCEGAVKRLT